ncbi:LysR family transcriptional regulator [Oceanobacter kriegii]|uniref:LysR family transcriptional regulator n=1 Tax=Oceanobacter kriegii TaxID=64972 RepID=UPI0004865DCD|nr:LysR family transcriptional regulator [Oceanobacter kriegii]
MKPTYSLDDMRCFCAVARLGSYKLASDWLNVPHSTLSRRIAKLEQDLKLRLLNRDAHRVQLTSTGQLYFDRCHHLFDELDDIATSLHTDNHHAKGRIRVAAPVNFGSHVLASHFNAFLRQYPDIQLDVRLDNRQIDIEEAAIDVAFRVGDHTAEHWVGRQLVDIRFLVCAPVSLNTDGIRHPSELGQLPQIICQPISRWAMVNLKSGDTFTHVPQQPRLEVDDISVLTRAIKDEIGIGMIPDYHAQPLIERGVIKQILPDWSNQPRGCQMLYRDRQNMPHRVRLLIDFMLERFV